MKMAKNLFLAGLCLLIVLACNKEKSLNTQSVASLEAAHKSLQTGEPLTIQLNNVPSGARLAWRVTPPQHASVQAGDLRATIVFSAPGSYTITAAWLQSTDSIPVFCDTVIVGDTTGHGPGDTTHHPSPCDTIINGDTVHIPCDTLGHDTIPRPTIPTYVPLTDDQLVVTPVLSDTGFAFTVRTVNLYTCLNASMSYATHISDSLIILSHGAVMIPPAASCVQGRSVVSCLHRGHLLAQDGTFPVQIRKMNTLFQGTVTVSNQGTKYTFNWPYTSGVTFTTTVVQR